MAAFTVQLSFDDLTLDPPHALILRTGAEKFCIRPGVEVESVSELCRRHRRLRPRPVEAAKLRRHAAHRPFANIGQRPPLRFAQIKLVEVNRTIALSVRTE